MARVALFFVQCKSVAHAHESADVKSCAVTVQDSGFRIQDIIEDIQDSQSWFTDATVADS